MQTTKPLMAYGIDATAIPDFIAGVLFGLTGDNYLFEIADCLQDGESIARQAEEVIIAFEGKHIIHALEELGDLAAMLPPALVQCENM